MRVNNKFNLSYKTALLYYMNNIYKENYDLKYCKYHKMSLHQQMLLLAFKMACRKLFLNDVLELLHQDQEEESLDDTL